MTNRYEVIHFQTPLDLVYCTDVFRSLTVAGLYAQAIVNQKGGFAEIKFI